MRKKKDTKRKDRRDDVVLLRDLTPRKDVKGGTGKVLFGERREETADSGGAAEADRQPEREGG